MGDGFTWDTQNPEKDKATAQKALDTVREELSSGRHQMIILDEINYVLRYKFLDEEEVLDLLRTKPEMTHIVCTGRDASPKLIELADLVTEMKCVKHPFKEQGIPAQKGIEF